ncbi:hypothetical protein [Streptomyces sp. NPDC003006]
MEDLPLHELGLLRGAVEGHDTRYLGSLLALDQHAHLMLRAALIVPIPSGAPRDDACQFYEATPAVDRLLNAVEHSAVEPCAPGATGRGEG